MVLKIKAFVPQKIKIAHIRDITEYIDSFVSKIAGRNSREIFHLWTFNVILTVTLTLTRVLTSCRTVH